MRSLGKTKVKGGSAADSFQTCREAMVTLRKRARTSEAPANLKEAQNDKTLASVTEEEEEEEEGSEYEQFREKRIKENMERMRKLGILDLSLKLKSVVPTPKCTSRNTTERKAPQSSPLPPPGPPRRSSRLENLGPVNYSDSYKTQASLYTIVLPSEPLLPSGPSRRSSRLQNADPINYSELPVNEEYNPGSSDDEEPWVGEEDEA